MLKSLNGGAIHVSIPSLDRGLELCKLGNFDAISMNPGWVEATSPEEVNGKLSAAGIKPGAWGVSFNWRGSVEEHLAGLEKFRAQAELMAKVGAKDCATWILPGSNEMNFDAFSEFHIERLTPVAAILRDNGMSFGMEFIGPKTLRDSFRFPWIYTMNEMLRFGSEIGPNVGILLDLWHLHTSGGTPEQISQVDPKRISLVHINDAPIGVSVDEMLDNKRAFPGSTGVLPLKEFMQALRGIDYQGTVEAEPFDETLKDLASDEDRVQKTAEAMAHAFGLN